MTALAAATIDGPGGSLGNAMSMGDIQTIFVPFSVTASASYDTGGVVWTPPAGLPGSWVLRQLFISNNAQGGYLWSWSGSASSPKILTESTINQSDTYRFVAPPEATAGTDLTTQVLSIPVAGTITAVKFWPSTTYTGAATNYRSWALNNITKTLIPATLAGAASTVYTANIGQAMVVGNTSNVAVTAGDVFTWSSFHTGTGLADPGGIVSVTFAPTAGREVASTTDLSAFTITGLAVYGA